MNDEPDFSDVYPHEVMEIINRADDIRSYLIEDIFEETVRLGYEASKDETTIDIDLGLEGVAGEPRWQLDWLIQKIKTAALQELASFRAIKPDYDIELRDRSKESAAHEVFAVLKYVPRDFLAWYGEEEMASKPLGEMVAYHPMLAKEIGEIPAAIYYMQLRLWWEAAYWAGWDGYMPKSAAEIQKATGLKKDAQIRIRNLLKEKGWLDFKERRVGRSDITHFITFKPLDFTSGKPESVVAEKIRLIKLPMAIQDKAALEQSLNEWQEYLVLLKNTLKDMPVRKLWKHARKKYGELPDEGGSNYIKHEDEIIETEEMGQYGGDENNVRRAWDDFNKIRNEKNELRDRITAAKQEIKSIKKQISELSIPVPES